jgi:Ca2+/Na+ antiporter
VPCLLLVLPTAMITVIIFGEHYKVWTAMVCCCHLFVFLSKYSPQHPVL